MSRQEDGDFLSRWSARKLEARSATPPQSALADCPQAEAPPEAGAPEKTEAEILEELGLPDPDSLVKGDDFKAFLRAGIPARLRTRALRRLWLSDPVLANLDGLNDYEQDFTDKATVRPDLKTAYRVGKGLLRDAPEASAAAESVERPAETLAEEDARGMAGGVPPGVEPDAALSVEANAGPGAEPADAATYMDEAPAEPSCRPRRMRFRFEVG